MAHITRIIGIDPGLRRTGWGVIETEGSRLGFVACGCVESSDRLSLAERLRPAIRPPAGERPAAAPEDRDHPPEVLHLLGGERAA